MSKIKKALNFLVFITLFILLGLLVIAALYNLSGEVFPLLVVKSGSMEPVLSRGDIILIEKVSPDEIRADIVNGDIIVFYKPGTNILIVHRAIRKVDGGFITKGDANTGSDYFSPVPPENIVGRWTGMKIPSWSGLGYLSLFLRGELYPPYGKIVLIVLLVINVVFIVKDILSRGKKNAQEEKKVES
ncbi:MAG: signal peptidase I [Aigarchaeota archaeon]|nr:signal peptidase I [Aigarchaeota archaeon]MCX8192811.1 signal peptidase I [Nitrososphaeria archaeon]MDW7986055.1 signal peptidase I [Nitrososphaerota archaeon]